MEIGGYDTIYQIDSPCDLYKEIINFVDWEDAVIEYDRGSEDFFLYENQKSKEIWDSEGLSEESENKMIYFLIKDRELTVVTDHDLTMKIRNKFPKYEKEDIN